jgi:hypothetical protein
VWLEDQHGRWERLHRDIRQRVAAIGRRVNTLCQDEEGLQHPLAVFHVYHHVVLPHARVRQSLPVPEPTHDTGSAKLWRPCTPAMAAEWTDPVWTLQEGLLLSRATMATAPGAVSDVEA